MKRRFIAIIDVEGEADSSDFLAHEPSTAGSAMAIKIEDAFGDRPVDDLTVNKVYAYASLDDFDMDRQDAAGIFAPVSE